MRSKVRHQLFLSPALTERLEALAAKPGASKSAILADAVDAWLNRKGASEFDDRFGLRLDRITTALGRVERNDHVLLETLSLFVRYMLAIHAPLADSDQAGRALGRQRFDAFVSQVGKQIGTGRRTIGDDDPEGGR
ncbi:MAG: CopG family transcriptional regulator [Sphingomonas bacterium]|uniref:CopG family transcriptional regulator n=1 Tax=Sphingomonas bacterium TaxID=1895847 RepID=UPI002627CD4B|nr:CopG family transcriptional regulator [Sphingomonas bacterium]MDB5706202.1 CopG family transcriptional regulator [Sphingomonas bacterium]